METFDIEKNENGIDILKEYAEKIKELANKEKEENKED